MAYEAIVSLSKLNLQPGTRIEVEGFVHRDPERFCVDLGTSEEEILLHFDCRFNFGRITKKIVCNTETNGIYDEEVRHDNFPFEEGKLTKLWFTFNGTSDFKIRLQDESIIYFPNRKGHTAITFMAIRGNIDVRGIWFHDP